MSTLLKNLPNSTTTKKLKFNKYKFFDKINYRPHEGQKKFHDSNKRFRILMCGRRWGKTLALGAESAQALIKKPNQLGWVVAPTYELSKKLFREVYWFFHKYLPNQIAFSSEREQIIKLHNGSMLQGKTADNPVSLIGEGLNFLILDEGARIKEDTWNEALRPTLTDKQGWAVFISTPKGKNWFYNLWKKGQDVDETDYQSWKFSTLSNPYIKAEEVDQARDSLPNLIFKQEYEAEPLSEEDMLFPTELIASCVKDIPKLQDPSTLKKYYLGVDFARMGQDSSVFVVAELQQNRKDIEIVHIEETKHKLLVDAIGRIKALHRKFNFDRIYLDETGIGAGPSDILKEELRITIVPITFTQKMKEDLYSNLKKIMELGRLKFNEHDKLMYQLLDLRYEYGSNGMLKIHHSDHGYDDYPDSLALAVWFAFGSGVYRPFYI